MSRIIRAMNGCFGTLGGRNTLVRATAGSRGLSTSFPAFPHLFGNLLPQACNRASTRAASHFCVLVSSPALSRFHLPLPHASPEALGPPPARSVIAHACVALRPPAHMHVCARGVFIPAPAHSLTHSLWPRKSQSRRRRSLGKSFLADHLWQAWGKIGSRM